MLVYDVTNEKSFDNIRNWIRNIEEVCVLKVYYAWNLDIHGIGIGKKCTDWTVILFFVVHIYLYSGHLHAFKYKYTCQGISRNFFGRSRGFFALHECVRPRFLNLW